MVLWRCPRGDLGRPDDTDDRDEETQNSHTSMMAENETRAVSSATTARYLSTNRGENIEEYEIVKGAKIIDVYIIHRGPDTKEAIVKPLASALNKLGVSTFNDTSPASMLPGDDNFVIMQHGLSGCRFAAVLLSETFLHSEHCVKEVNTMLKREQEENKRLLIPFYYGISLDDSRFEVLKYRNALLKNTHEGARTYTIKMVKSILGKLERPIPSSRRLTNLFLDYDQSLREINGVLPSGPCQGKTKRRYIVVVVLLLTVAAAVVAWQLLQDKAPETDPPFTNAPPPTVAPMETTVDQSTALPTVQPVPPLTSCVVGERCNCGMASDGATIYMEGFSGDDTALKVQGCGGEFGVNPSADGWERKPLAIFVSKMRFFIDEAHRLCRSLWTVCCETCAKNLQMEDQISAGWLCETIYDDFLGAVPTGIMLKGVNKV